MRLTWRDGLATLFVAAATLVYALWATGTGLTGTSTRVLGVMVFGLGWAACVSDQARMAAVFGVGDHRRPPMTYVVSASILGGVAFVAGVIVLVTASEAMLAVLVVSMIALWILSTVRHAVAVDAPAEDRTVGAPLHKAA